MLFGFDDKQEFIPQIYRYLNNQELMLTFLTQYNASVDSALKIPLLYAKNTKSLKMIFGNFLHNIMHVSFGKIQNINIKLNTYAFYFQKRKSLIFNTKISKNVDLLRLLRIYLYGICFDAQILFSSYVYDKISFQNNGKNIDQDGDLIIIDKKFAILPLCKEINTHNLEIENEIYELLNLIKENNFEKFYIVCPRNKNFTHFIEIKHFLCDLNKTMLKLVPYKISNQIIRRK
ncbi:hypothetical protein D8W01_05475 [Campylobacter jejuni]|nr:hypothetical protein [Campylobacter jejuni]EAH9558635.1 hypothetical protein [Campylobacter jejuni]EAI4471798.1 hypothetical protein [Campylobacter jejuni]EAK5945265.1 hypothetical protein [Campylobacter jejuni]EIX1316794.1 hypothetical protein [Campylobacter jejuni]